MKKAMIDSSVTNNDLLNALDKANIPVAMTDTKTIIKDYRKGKKQLHFVPKKGEKMDTCATINDKYVCCNVKVLKSVSNCPFDCSYCFLQEYLNDGTTQVVSDIDAMMAEVRDKCSAEPQRIFRIGTWELGDSLALERETGQAATLIKSFATIPNALLELKTKSDCVDSILNCDHQQKTVVSWSLNTKEMIEKEEHRTARLHERLTALKKVTNAGYLVGLHFDPMLMYDDWKQGYKDLIDQVFQSTNIKQIAWISLGSLRFNPNMKKKMEHHFPGSDLTAAEMVLGDDNKMRYVKPLRLAMYEHVLSCLSNYCGSDLSPLNGFSEAKPLFYFCMERWDVWHHFFGASPTSIEHLDYLFAESLTVRFPQLGLPAPVLDDYLASHT